MWLTNDVVTEVNRVARVFYIDKSQTKLWNDNRHGDELRMFTGWAYVARHGGETRQGLKTQSVAFREAHYALVQKTVAPTLRQQRLRVISSRKVA